MTTKTKFQLREVLVSAGIPTNTRMSHKHLQELYDEVKQQQRYRLKVVCIGGLLFVVSVICLSAFLLPL